MKAWFLALLLPFLLVLQGCSHPMTLSPSLANLAVPGTARSDKKVGLLVTDADRQLEVTTPGGGGDKVSYFPYRDLETSIYYALSQSFAGVSRVGTSNDPKIASEGLSYVITPRLTTTSFSDSVLTWPPTIFTVDLVCKVTDASGKPVTEIRVVGEGRASFDEFKGQPALSANRAAEAAVKKLIKHLGEAAVLR